MSDFPTKENPKLCSRGCGTRIYLSKDTGKYLPYNLDDTLHKCSVTEQDPSSSELSERSNNNNNKEELKFDYNDVAVLDKILKIAKHAVEHDNKEFNK